MLLSVSHLYQHYKNKLTFTLGEISVKLPISFDSFIMGILGRSKLGSFEYGATTGATTSSGSFT